MKPLAPVNVHDAKTRFPKLLAQVQRGHEIVIAKAGTAGAVRTGQTQDRASRQSARHGLLDGR